MVFNGRKIGTQKNFVRSQISLDQGSLDRGLRGDAALKIAKNRGKVDF